MSETATNDDKYFRLETTGRHAGPYWCTLCGQRPIQNYKKHRGNPNHTVQVAALHEGKQSTSGQGTDAPGGLEGLVVDPETSHNWGFDGRGNELDFTPNQPLFNEMDEHQLLLGSSLSDLDDLVSQGLKGTGQDESEAEASEDEETDSAGITNLLTTNEQKDSQLKGLLLMGMTRNLISQAECDRIREVFSISALQLND
ncbi:hypothetical protein CROQUDRAFT_107460 [Cronartium quercuum f. sp. fusiforme G11]|uniref:Uncharacterized protein n=1 Tax=Cronartium quercuum f. sp. fusiforme G11 TaxID=708437 RepID=A0A9P6NHW7_9BASI|nr:hypothetical protein CROQUDRAFT_107460 [Cronartium quercuum f. sp. fusiforme G11]